MSSRRLMGFPQLRTVHYQNTSVLHHSNIAAPMVVPRSIATEPAPVKCPLLPIADFQFGEKGRDWHQCETPLVEAKNE